VHANLTKLNITRIVIAHRMKTVREADLILVVDQGHITQRGNFEALQREEGLFRQLNAPIGAYP
jgi:ABC-type multidrug transport system fused ATPase/permease subunit